LTFDRLGDLNHRRGIDIGCGSGPYLAQALRRGAAHMVALDPAPRMLDLTRHRVQKIGQVDRLTTLEGYFPQALPAGRFDFAIVMGVMDYVEDPEAFLRALKGGLAGPAAVSFPGKHWFRTPLRKIRYRLRQCPLYFYDQPSIRSLGSRAGFTAVDIIKIPGTGLDYHVVLRP
jgi:SAM-dependent methyltransferase